MTVLFRRLLPAALLLTGLVPLTARAQRPEAPPSSLPVRGVTLFTSGVSYIERGGEVDGDATVPLLFRTAQINDILKSLVLLDAKGTVQPATYGARDPIGRALQSFAVDVRQNLSRGELLNRLRGAKVTVETIRKETLTGQIVGVERREETVKEKTVTVETLTLLAEAGLQSARLEDVRTIRLLDARLDREFREALTVLASGADDQRRQVTLRFSGQGRRDVRVGYVTESPLWKMTYRLVLGEGAAAKPYLQGWALVENTTDDDWNGIRLALVSGRPVSFIQDLYQPLYLPRPVVPNEVVASPYPQTHGGDLLEERRRETAEEAERKRVVPSAPAPGRSGPEGFPGAGGLGGGFRGALPQDSNAPTAFNLDNSLLLDRSVAAQAQGESAGELFQYQITTPVTLPRQQAAMIPVVAQDIDGEKLSLYNADTTPRFPLNAVRVKNTTALHLKGGPVTLFDDGVYAGDARMEDIPPGDSRLVTYAVDLALEGERQGTGTTTVETALSLKRGVLTITRRERQETTYTVKSKADRPRVVLVEHPFQPGYTLLAPAAPTERTARVYRFAVTVAPGKAETLKVTQERPLAQTIALLDADLNALSVYTSRADIPARTRAALQDIVQRRRRVQELAAQAGAREAEIKAIGEEQDRIRKNMAALDRNSALYKRYVGELDRQETRIQALRAEAQRLRNAAGEADRALRAYLDERDIAP